MTAIVPPTGHRYLELVRENSLRIIRSEDEYDRAIATVDRLSDQGNGRTPDETEYLLALSVIIEKYEEEHHRIPTASGVDTVRYLMVTRHRTQSAPQTRYSP